MKRTAAFRRVPVQQGAQQVSRDTTFPAPVRGWITNENLAASRPAGAFRLENWFPTTKGIRLRGGSTQHATIGAGPVSSLFSYKSGSIEEMFASDATSIYDVSSPADPEVAPTASVTGQTSGYYSTAQYETAGGDYLYAVNGDDSARLYDGTNFYIINDLSTFGLAYDAETGNFTVGLTVTGGTSGATATIIEIDDDGTTGTLYVQSITGTFADNETITDTSTGSATSDIPSGVSTYNSIVITGVATANLSQVWSYRSRIYFVEKDTMSAWYLPVDSVGGAATEVSLRGVFQRGGSLLLGATWSLDAGDGVDDKCVFISTEGEAAVYEGSSPGGADWQLVGRYDITKPLGKNATMQAGGDLLVMTREGIVPISAALTKDTAALSLSAITRAIEPEWRNEVTTRTTLPWEIVKWTDANMAIVALPAVTGTTDPYCFVVNVETGAWAKFTGWDTRCLAVYANQAYFGTSDGTILSAEVGGSDDGANYECVYVGLFDHLRTPGRDKHVHSGRSVFIASQPFTVKVSASVDYAVQLPAAPAVAANAASGSEWDVGVWDVATWDAGGIKTVSTKWASIGRQGFAIAPQLQVTVGNLVAPDAELVAFDIIYEPGGIMV